MRFTGRNLAIVVQGLQLLKQEISNEIVTCPDPDDPDNAKRIDELDKEYRAATRLFVRALGAQ